LGSTAVQYQFKYSLMKLIVVSHSCSVPSNQELYARVQAQTGWDLTLVVPSRWKHEYGRLRASRWPGFEGELVPLRVALAGNIPLHFYLASMRRLFRRRRPDLIYMHHEPYGVSTAQVFRAAGDTPVGFYSSQNLVKGYPPPISILEKRCFERAAFAVSLSASVAEVLREKGYRGPLEVLPACIDTRRWRRAGAGREGDAPLTVGYIGRLSPEKGVDTLIEALARVANRDVRAVIAGDGPDRGRLQELASRLGLDSRIRWSGYVPHDRAMDFYGEIDVSVVPSRTTPRWKEQFGRVVIESLACEVPVVGSDSGELASLIPATAGGWTFPEGDAQRLAELLDWLDSDPEALHAAGREGRLAVERNFDLDLVAGRFAEIASRAAAGSRSNRPNRPRKAEKG
jgi:glycosyltransferase involved in cell wall biosynthesis